MNLINQIEKFMLSDDANRATQSTYLKKAYDDNDCEMLLIALCGYGMETISNNRRESTE